MYTINDYGLTDYFTALASAYPDLTLCRVISQAQGIYRLVHQEGEFFATPSGKLRHEALSPMDLPAVGDFVMAEKSEGDAQIKQVLPRKSVFLRKSAGKLKEEQIIAANVDYVFICMALSADYNLSRLERYLAAVYAGGAKPVVILTKADLCEDTNKYIKEVEGIAPYCDILALSLYDNDIEEKLSAYLKAGKTISLAGSSGVGKSTLINRLIDSDLLATGGLRSDEKGRHTTTMRLMIPLKCKGVIMDTPGMRELGLISADFEESFSDIADLAYSCRFSDCTHTNEPGCAVKKAIEEGTLSHRRYDNYLKLQKEAGYDGLNSRQIEDAKIQRMFGSKKEMKQKKDKYKGR